MNRAWLALAALTLATAAGAQVAHNVTLLARFNPGGTFSDCWGYAAPDGREYALLGADDRTWIVDCTDPTQPKPRGAIPGSASGWQPSAWRDIKTYRHYAYVITEGGGGMQIIDLRDPDQPQLLSTFGQPLWTHAHNMFIDEAVGTAWVCGTDADTLVLDLATDPENPIHLNTFSFGGYVHELHVQHGFAYIADLRNNDLTILDVTTPTAINVLSRTATPGARFAHSAWATPDDLWCLTANEIAGGPIGIFDVSVKRLPRLVSQISFGPSVAIPHDVYEHDRVLHASYYTEGYQIADFSDPYNPVAVAHYDTFGGASGGFNGAWGCYPLQPSGAVYVSDIGTGLWVFRTPTIAKRYGQGTPGTANVTPELRPLGTAYLGSPSFGLALDAAAPSSRCALLVGLTPTSIPVAGVTLLVDLTNTSVAIDLTTDPQGQATLSLPVPFDLSLEGIVVYAQALIADPGASAGLAASGGLQLTVFRK